MCMKLANWTLHQNKDSLLTQKQTTQQEAEHRKSFRKQNDKNSNVLGPSTSRQHKPLDFSKWLWYFPSVHRVKQRTSNQQIGHSTRLHDLIRVTTRRCPQPKIGSKACWFPSHILGSNPSCNPLHWARPASALMMLTAPLLLGMWPTSLQGENPLVHDSCSSTSPLRGLGCGV